MMIKKLILSLVRRFLNKEDIIRLLIEKEFIYWVNVNITSQDMESVWKKIVIQYPIVRKWIELRKNQLLYQVLGGTSKDFIAGALGEWFMIENFYSSIPENKQIKQPQEEEIPQPPDVMKVIGEYKRSQLEKEKQNATH